MLFLPSRPIFKVKAIRALFIQLLPHALLLVFGTAANPCPPPNCFDYTTAGGWVNQIQLASDPLDMASSGDLLLLIDEAGNLVILEGAGTYSLEVIAQLHLGTDLHAIDSGNDLAFVAVGDSGLVVVDLQDPHLPALAGVFPTDFPALDVSANGSLVAVAADSAGLILVDCTQPYQPVLLAQVPFEGLVDAVSWISDSCYVKGAFSVDYVGDRDFLSFVSVVDPTAPSLAGDFIVQSSYDCSNDFLDFSASGDLASIIVYSRVYDDYHYEYTWFYPNFAKRPDQAACQSPFMIRP